ncbi:hypothetical protein [Burkholderia sp. LA-2-3-30-S1-D2]|nr:hypothetical protein [Burkholderia sp. LA-2-3-30-S1-D2]
MCKLAGPISALQYAARSAQLVFPESSEQARRIRWTEYATAAALHA